jgi:rod shape-determining protein MreB
MLNKIFSFFSKDLAIDLGTANSLVYVKNEGIVLNEPSVIAINQKTGQILAIGEEAKKMVGKTPAHIVALRPLVDGVVSDFEITQEMLRFFIEKANKGRPLFRSFSRVIIGVPVGATEVERKAVIDAAKNAGAREVYLIEEPLSSAIGARLPIQEPGGNFIVDIGGGTTEIVVISLGGIVCFRSLRVAGDELNRDIVDYVQSEFKLAIGERTAEEVKKAIGTAIFPKEKKEMPLRGRNIVTGLPEEIMISNADVYRAMEKSINLIVGAIKEAIEDTPPELLSDIMANGIFLSGGGALLSNLPELITKKTKIPARVIEDPLTAMVRGAGIVLENLDKYGDIVLTEDIEMPPKI